MMASGYHEAACMQRYTYSGVGALGESRGKWWGGKTMRRRRANVLCLHTLVSCRMRCGWRLFRSTRASRHVLVSEAEYVLAVMTCIAV